MGVTVNESGRTCTSCLAVVSRPPHRLDGEKHDHYIACLKLDIAFTAGMIKSGVMGL